MDSHSLLQGNLPYPRIGPGSPALQVDSLPSEPLPAMQEARVWSLGLEDSPGEGNGYPLQYSCLGNPMDRGSWQATVHGVKKSWTLLSDKHISKKFQSDNKSHFLFFTATSISVQWNVSHNGCFGKLYFYLTKTHEMYMHKAIFT